MRKDDLGDRMKMYEEVSKGRLVKKVPVALRVDGKAFHTFTQGFAKPFDWVLMKTMQHTMIDLCMSIQGAKFAYTQSDEITIILTDYDNINTSAWFDYEVQKLCSITASMTSLFFYKHFAENYVDFQLGAIMDEIETEVSPLYNAYSKAFDRGAMFDCRCFNIPEAEVGNLLYWRQLDAMRNSVQAVGQAHFSHKQLQGLSCNAIKDKLITEKQVNWIDYPITCQRGTACYKKDGHWFIDEQMPILKDDWDYVFKHIRRSTNAE